MKNRKHEILNSLKGKIKEECLSYRKVSTKSGISLNAFNNKINGYSVFNTDEVSALVEILNIEPNDIIKYFFPQMFQNVS